MTLSPIIFEKMTITCTEETEGGMTITFDWDDTDPVFKPWCQMPEHEKHNYIYNAFSNKLQKNLDVEAQ
jgi:hypothetical protein